MSLATWTTKSRTLLVLTVFLFLGVGTPRVDGNIYPLEIFNGTPPPGVDLYLVISIHYKDANLSRRLRGPLFCPHPTPAGFRFETKFLCISQR